MTESRVDESSEGGRKVCADSNKQDSSSDASRNSMPSVDKTVICASDLNLDKVDILGEEYFPMKCINTETDSVISATSTTGSTTTASTLATRLPDGSIIEPLNMDQLICTEELLEEELGVYPVKPGSTSHCYKSLYGQPNLSKTVSDVIGPIPTTERAAGLRYDAILLPDERPVQERLIKRRLLNPKNFIDSEIGNIKPRRGPNPVVYISDFMKSLVQINSPFLTSNGDNIQHRRWVFSGVLNGWPGLQTLEVLSITCRLVADKVSFLFEREGFSSLHHTLQKLPTRLVRIWSLDKQGADGSPPYVSPEMIQKAIEIRVTMRAPNYTAKGYSINNTGYVFWFESQRRLKQGHKSDLESHLEPRLLYGEDIIKTMEREGEAGDGNATCTKVHMLSHRYATGDKREHPKDKLTYHSVLILEWSHGQYVTIVESALLNGLGGYAGKSNWYDDKLDDFPKLYEAMPPCMIQPWTTHMSEIRCFDLPHSRNIDEFKEYVKRYTGPKLRFIDPHWTHSNRVRLCYRTKMHIARYLWNYIRRNPQYSEINRNCQTFSADLYGFLAGKSPQDIQPFHPLNRVDYKNRSHCFLYDPEMYTESMTHV
mmetsp:Transcript_4389/g.6500  ORF Transcript_4389/g.6500 Transcript_4389/m.6500 type:complete len:597 (+) Transcript_4389:75-1865(+)